MYIKFTNKRTNETFRTGTFTTEDAMWNKYWSLRKNKTFANFEVVNP